jgi:excisionase family DNA binding protein
MHEENERGASCPNLGNLADVGRVAGVADRRRFDGESPVAALGPALLTVKQVAMMLGVSSRTIHRLVASGDLPGPVKVGSASRFPCSEIEEYLERLKAERRDRTHGGTGK